MLPTRGMPSLFEQMANELSAQLSGFRPTTSFSGKYFSDPVAFVHDCFYWDEGRSPTFYQDEIMAAIGDNKRVCVRGPHGLGKSTLLAWVVIWFTLTRDKVIDFKVPTTASVFRQLQRFLWPEIHKWISKINWDRVGRKPFSERVELTGMNIRLSTGEAFAMSSNRPDLIEGAHASELLFVFDEAKSIEVPTWNSVEGAFSTGQCYWLAFSTPGEPAGRFYDIQARKPGYDDWWVRHITLDEAISAGRIDNDWVEQRRLQWGEQSAVFQNRVLGEFAASGEDSIVPLAWVEKAMERYEAWVEEHGDKLPEFTCVGVDIARYGEDKTVLATRYGSMLHQLRYFPLQDTMETTGLAAGLLLAKGGYAVVDVVGQGAGVVDRMKEMKLDVRPFNASGKSDLKDRSGELAFLNARAAAWWGMRELLDPNFDSDIMLPPDDMLIGDLTAPRWRISSGGKIQTEAKDDIRARIGRSPDSGDAVVMAFFRASDDETPSLDDIAAYGSNKFVYTPAGRIKIPKEMQAYAASSGIQIDVETEEGSSEVR